MRRNGRVLNRKGRSLPELLIVMLIIGILMAICVPIYLRFLERSREATDLANARNAYAELMLAVVSGETGYDENNMVHTDGTYRVAVEPLSQKRRGWTTNIEEVTLGGIPSKDWKGLPEKGGYCELSYSPAKDRVTIRWGGGFRPNSYKTLIESDIWYDDTPERRNTFAGLHEINNEDRIKADSDILKSIASRFESMDAAEAEKILGEERFSKLRDNAANAQILFRYGQDEKGSVVFSRFATSYQPYLTDIGYTARVYSEPGEIMSEAKDNEFLTQEDKGINYVNRYLFTSNEMIGSKYAKKTQNNIYISFNVVGDDIKFVKVWVARKSGAGLNSDN